MDKTERTAIAVSPLHEAAGFGSTLHESMSIWIDLDSCPLGPIDPLVLTAIRHLCGFYGQQAGFAPVTWENFDVLAKQYYDKIASLKDSGTQRLIFMAYLSGFFHELRHVHDLMATTYGQGILFKFFNCYQNTPQLLAELTDWQRRNPTGKIPLPLVSTIETGEILSEEMGRLLAAYSKASRDMESLETHEFANTPKLTVTRLLEASAVNAQLGLINELFGSHAYYHFLTFINQGSNAQTYLQVRNDLNELFESRDVKGSGLGAVIDYLIWATLTLTSHASSPLSEGPNPVLLFEALAEYVIRRAGILQFDSIVKIVDEFYDEWGFKRPRLVMREYHDVLEKRRANLAEHWHDPELQEFSILSDTYEGLVKSHSRTNDWLKDHPELYFGPNYFWSVVGRRLPSALAIVRHNGRIERFLTPGETTIPYEGWDTTVILATTINILLKGRAVAPLQEIEEEAWRELTMPGGAGPLFFEDKLFADS